MLTDKIISAADQLRSQARTYGATAMDAARESALKAASRVTAAKRPVRLLAEASLRFTTLSGRYFERILGKQAEIIETVIDAGAERLKSAARAENFRTLLQDQREMRGDTRERLAKELRDSWGITKASGREMRQLAVDTYVEVVHGQKVAAPKPRRKRAVKAKRTVKARKSP